MDREALTITQAVSLRTTVTVIVTMAVFYCLSTICRPTAAHRIPGARGAYNRSAFKNFHVPSTSLMPGHRPFPPFLH